MVRPGGQVSPVRASVAAPALAALGLLAAVALGSWWIAGAVAEGHTASMLVRLALTVAGGFYYLVMYRIATGRSIGRR